MTIHRRYQPKRKLILHLGDCIELLKQMPDECVDLVITSPPYCMGKEYEETNRIEDFIEAHNAVLPEIVRVTKKGGSICWQVGNHVNKGVVTPLDFVVADLMKKWPEILLRNRIVWTFRHGMHSKQRLSGRHETILWFTKGNNYTFNLDRIRIPQLYPGKRHYKGARKGKFSCNPLGKNPSDVWELPNVKAQHVEKTKHPCQFPIALAQRLIRGLTMSRGRVLDPFMGVGSSAAAAILEKRRFVGAEIKEKYYFIATKRCIDAAKGVLKYRKLEKPIAAPDPKTEVARNPFTKRAPAPRQNT